MTVAHHLAKVSSTNDVFLNGPNISIVGNKLAQYWLNSKRNLKYLLGQTPFLLKYALYSEIYRRYPRECDEYMSFAVIRDPYDRTRSIFNYIYNTKFLPRDKSLKQAFDFIRKSASADIINQYDSLIKLNYFKPQYSYITSNSSAIAVQTLVPLHSLNHWLSTINNAHICSFSPVVKNKSDINYCQHNHSLISKLTKNTTLLILIFLIA